MYEVQSNYYQDEAYKPLTAKSCKIDAPQWSLGDTHDKDTFLYKNSLFKLITETINNTTHENKENKYIWIYREP